MQKNDLENQNDEAYDKNIEKYFSNGENDKHEKWQNYYDNEDEDHNRAPMTMDEFGHSSEEEPLLKEEQIAINADYHYTQFWKTDDQYNIDDLLGDY